MSDYCIPKKAIGEHLPRPDIMYYEIAISMPGFFINDYSDMRHSVG